MGRDFNKSIGGGHVRDLISAYIDGALSAAEQEQVRAHVAACVECRSDYVELKAAKSVLRALPSEAPPRAFTLTPHMVKAGPTAGESFFSRLLAPALAPRLATGSLVAFVLLLFVVVADVGTANRPSLASVAMSQSSNSGASAYGATTQTAGPNMAMAAATAETGVTQAQSAPKAPASDSSTAQGTTGASDSTAAGVTPSSAEEFTPTNDMPAARAATAPSMAASGNSSPTTVSLAQPSTDGATSATGGGVPPQAQPSAANAFSPTRALEAVLSALAAALAGAAAIARFRGNPR